MELADLRRISDASIRRAGPRYTPALDPNAPNLQIAPLVETFDALTFSAAFKTRLSKLETDLREAWSGSSKILREALTEVTEAPLFCADLLRDLRTQAPGLEPEGEGRLRQTYETLASALGNHEGRLRAERNKHASGSPARRGVESALSEVRQLFQPLGVIGDFISSTAYSATFNNRLFLRGEWGTGKTHLLCDVARERLTQGLPTLLILAQALPAGMDPFLGLIQTFGLSADAETALQELDRLGTQAGGRALILIDAINEGDRVAWREHVEQIALLIGRYPNVSLALSCRTPFDQQILTEAVTSSFVFASHVGFTDIEFDAQTEFFRYYGIPHPHIPLLAFEFSRPLFLKILCTSIANLSQAAKKRRIKSFASGHKGMTKLLEDFVCEIGAGIERDFGLPSKACWNILKGRGDTAMAVGIAPKMADLMDDQITLVDAIAIVSQVTNFNNVRARELIIRLINDGLLSEDSKYEADNWIDTIRLPYQRFSDHLVSRHLLVRYLDASSPKTIRDSFRPRKPLGRLFKRQRWGGYELPGLASAVMLEFPERVKRVVHPDRRELAYYLPPKFRTYDLSQPFIEGLIWRGADSFSKQTDKLVDVFLKATSGLISDEMLEALVSLASRPDHHFQAERLQGYLLTMKLPDRDLFWTEFLRSRSNSSAAYRVLDWIQQYGSTNMEQAVAKNLIALVSLFLTSTVRPFRDRATHCLVLLGERSPESLFTEASRSFAFNDPYVSERMLASAYGVLMRRWAFPSAGLGQAALPLALQLKNRLIGAEDEAPIEHILIRDYAQGFVELTARLVPDRADELLNDERRVSPKTVLRPPSRISEKSVEGAKSAIHMDFGNYTIGRLVSGRSNYDDAHTGYRAIRRRIERRILDLGYDVERFSGIDRLIAQRSFYARQSNDGQKTDRYGKKYSWIAFFEVAGRLALRGRLPDRWEARLSDIDIDPSFPSAPLAWRPPLQDLFGEPSTSAADWLKNGLSPEYRDLLVLDSVDGQKGPWVLLDGYISEGGIKDQRKAFTFLRGILVKPREIKRVHTAVKNIEYPGNHTIPEPASDHYLFAGEIGWSDKYGSQRPGGQVKPDVDEAFGRSEAKKVTKRYADLSPLDLTRLQTHILIIGTDGGVVPEEKVEYGPDDLVTLDVFERVPGVKVEVPVRHFAWESYHSEENQTGAPYYPSPAMVRSLNLRKFGSQVDMFDQRHRLATIYREFQADNSSTRSHLLYLRADVLEEYARQRRMSLVWVNWGEREMDYSVAEGLRDDPEMQTLWGEHAHIHKEFLVYKPIEGRAE